MAIPETVYYVIGLVFCAFYALLKWNDLKYRRKGLPPGTMGLPFIGETSLFLKGPDFMKLRKSMYGNLFKTHALGSPMVISMDPEVNRYILMNEAKGLVPGYPDSMKNILGVNIAEVHGAVHKRVRGSLLSIVGPVALRDQVLTKIDKFMRSFLHNWDGKTIDIQQKSTQMAFFVALELVVENEPSSFHESFEALFENIFTGTISLPFNFPGTNYYQGLKAREKVDVILKMLLAKRKASSVIHDDNLQQLLESDSKYKLDEEEVIEQIITILYSGYETVSTTTMMAVKYLYDHPKALQAIREEHFNIKQNKRPEELISWDDYKKMSFTRAVILETLRLANVVNGELRRTIKDVELNVSIDYLNHLLGFIIPKGWRVYVYTRESNLDPFVYPEPLTFNPWRWLVGGGRGKQTSGIPEGYCTKRTTHKGHLLRIKEFKQPIN
ncbi:unnamed protein product [Lupinus luteus]|uniref:Uncharacterized protein n=1 Tax=Lupinus luteus TaxID=3873 RepID=A0AAV1X918_LUPLU